MVGFALVSTKGTRGTSSYAKHLLPEKKNQEVEPSISLKKKVCAVCQNGASKFSHIANDSKD